jgi:uncharacterized protein DUF3570
MLSVALCAACALLASEPSASRADEVGTGLYIRTDSDHTTVISPRVRAKGQFDPETSLEVVYAVDVWTSASIDIRAAASHVVSEQRDEIDANFSHALGDVTLAAGYRWSKENDYLSNSGNASLAYNFADNAATLSVSGWVSQDAVGRSGYPSFDESLSSFGGKVGFTQVLDTKSLLQLSYDLAYLDGYQASPYRFVPIGGMGACANVAPMCVPERNPEKRLRHAPVVRVRRAFGDNISLGVGYRFYLDDWSLHSHTIEADFAWLPDAESQLGLRYRFYVQSAAEFYKPHYAPTDNLEFVTIDRELSALSIHRIGADYERGFMLGNDTVLRASIGAGVNLYKYDDFPGLKNVTALEVSAALALQL